MMRNLIVTAVFLLLVTSALGQQSVRLDPATGAFVVEGLPASVPQRPILDNSNPPQAGADRVPSLVGDWQAQQNSYATISTNDQIQPGAYGVQGVWSNGDNAVIKFTWSRGTATVGCTVGDKAGDYPPCDLNQFMERGSGNNVIVQGLQYQIMHNEALRDAPIWSGMPYQAIPNYPAAGNYGFGYLTTRRVYDGGVGWSVSSSLSSHPHQIVLRDPVNQLDGPVGIFLYRHRPPDSTQMPQDYDYINSILFHGATTDAPAGGIPMVRIDAWSRNVGAPIGMLSINTQCAGGGGIANGNGCLRFSIAEGIAIGNLQIDPGAGSLLVRDVIITGGYSISELPKTTFPGARAYVTDQLDRCPASGDAFTRGGRKVCPAFYDGVAWGGGG